MNLIAIHSRPIGDQPIQTANARELHAFLEVGKDFSSWITNRIEQFGFIANIDYVTFHQNGGKGRPTIEYAVTLDMAKELSMVERTEKGKEARRYFIECEKRAKEQPVSGVASASKLVGELAILECYKRLLNPSPSSQVAMLAHIAENNGLEPSFLPAYVVDAAPDSLAGSSMVTKPLTELLVEHGISISPRTYNRLLADAGMQAERVRKSTSKRAINGTKRFWTVTEAGLVYGKNITNPNSPRETQPHWYVERFADLHALVSSRLVGVPA